MDRLEHNGRGQTESIDHINRIGLDNRKENLRLLSQSRQNCNQKRKPRKSILPSIVFDKLTMFGSLCSLILIKYNKN